LFKLLNNTLEIPMSHHMCSSVVMQLWRCCWIICYKSQLLLLFSLLTSGELRVVVLTASLVYLSGVMILMSNLQVKLWSSVFLFPQI
jgi:hypothetical protein